MSIKFQLRVAGCRHLPLCCPLGCTLFRFLPEHIHLTPLKSVTPLKMQTSRTATLLKAEVNDLEVRGGTAAVNLVLSFVLGVQSRSRPRPRFIRGIFTRSCLALALDGLRIGEPDQSRLNTTVSDDSRKKSSCCCFMLFVTPRVTPCPLIPS